MMPWEAPGLQPYVLAAWLQASLAAWLGGHPWRAPFLLAALMAWAARGDSWRVHILPVAGLLGVAVLRLGAILAVWQAIQALRPPLWHGSLLLTVQASALLSGILLLRGSLFLMLLATLRLVLVMALAGAGTLHRRQRLVDAALRLAAWLERNAALNRPGNTSVVEKP